jgi:hypothetical protein
MRQKISKLLVLLLIPFAYYVLVSGYNSKEETEEKEAGLPVITYAAKDFINMIFNFDYFGMGANWQASWSIRKHRSYYKDSLHFNAIQIYGGDQGGAFNQPISEYRDNVQTLMGSVDSVGLKGYYGRQKIEKLCYGQRLVYEAEGNGNTNYNYGFSYQTDRAPIEPDSGRTVVHACPGNCPGTSSPNSYICENIYQNLQHSDLLDWQEGDKGNWHIKPMMRIPQNTPDETPVVRIDVINYTGTIIDTITIKAFHFKDNGTYNGNYVEKYFNMRPGAMQVSGRYDTTGGLSYGYNGKYNCKVDFKIYWYGQVEVWFDKMTVDDQKAYELLRGDHDDKIIEEVNAFTGQPGMYTFFADEMTYSNIPCVKYVQNLMKQTNSNAKLSCALTNYFNFLGFKHYNEAWAHEFFINEIQPERITCDAHEIFGPDFLPQDVFSNYDHNLVSSAWFKSASDYNRYLQERVLGDKNSKTDEDYYFGTDATYLPSPWGSFVYQVSLARTRTNELNPPAKLVIQPQIHAYLHDLSPFGSYDYGVREPLNEEIQAEAMIALAHGADGICWFWFQNTHSFNI